MVCDGISHTQLKSALWMDVTKSDIVIITGGSKVQTIFCDRRSVPITANSVSSRSGTGSQLCTGRIPTFFRDVILLCFICSTCFLEILKSVCKNKLNASNLQFIFNFLSSIWITIRAVSFECRKVIGFAFTTLRDWLKRFAPLFYPIRSKTKANCDALACIFPRFASATCNYFEFWLVQCIVCVLCDWPE